MPVSAFDQSCKAELRPPQPLQSHSEHSACAGTVSDAAQVTDKVCVPAVLTGELGRELSCIPVPPGETQAASPKSTAEELIKGCAATMGKETAAFLRL